ncbi:Hypothetical predicted protein [Olea europaea subsp. europaea]|uniref:Transcription repressor n=2 Tax=Olea europaea subsp. europaea TaxID=158383 RepID=A0A8S0PBC4_OLEEU|nr:Hypothetical predicted protein [Olea europaea subsp. europaea]
MENCFKMRLYRMFQSSLTSCKSKNTIDDVDDPTFIPKTNSHQRSKLIEHFLPPPRPFPFMCRPKWPERLSEERKCLLVSTEIEGRKCPPVSPISPFNTHYEFQKIYSEKKTRKSSNKKENSRTKKFDFSEYRDKEEFTTEKRCISNGLKAGARSRRAQRKIFKEGLMPLQGRVKDSLAVVKRSSDPYTDFRTSMVEMIMEKQIFTAKELENLLQCFLSLNSYHHHRVIIQVFSDIWEALFVSHV